MAVSIKGKRTRASLGELPIAPMIDVVFLLLVYFMVSSSIQRQEADVGFALPAKVAASEPIDFPDDQVVEVDAEGRAWVNGYPYDGADAARYWELAKMLSRFREASELGGAEAKVTLAPADQTPHQSVVKVLDACAMAGLESVSFATD
ncbi:biopolymer transporter ExbD [Pelagicoccus sp. SDUM812003]|uniref:ExbD/TolR family protein n=1 Tax=Pelagicoccus sp. SDUM812003 TaxID=3041267 RepID=UPI00280C7E39|nr:biopolymer transporter ExbD [Pelagicoccus sp. SDUM812003]MDQ8203238.1 biopolymer transporter ExbD [Pelagicoccus sp. SDUM812003]